MKLVFPSKNTGRRAEAFTMIEIAISLGVVTFALVAILGVLPTGMRVQKDNLEDTIVNQDGTLLMEAIRSGARGSDELTNFFDSITISNSLGGLIVYTNDPRSGNYLSNGTAVIGRLSTPKYFFGRNNEVTQNSVSARVRAMTGSALSRDPGLRDFAFDYLLTSEVIPFDLLPVEATNDLESGLGAQDKAWRTANRRLTDQLRFNSWEVRLTIQWPFYQESGRWKVGGNRKVFRTFVAGQMASQDRLFFLMPNTFVQAPAK